MIYTKVRERWKGKMGPNDAKHVVLALGELFFFVLYNSN